MAEPLRLMAVHAHPDDESSKGAATMAKYLADGAEVMVVTCTGGERGDILNPALEGQGLEENIVAVRREEMANAQKIVGFEHVWLGFHDSGMPDEINGLPEGCFAAVPVDEAAAPLVKAIREFRPHVILTYDENGGYPHPDHIMTHTVTMAAFEAANDPERYLDAGDPWQPLKVYYHMGFSKKRFLGMHEAILAAGKESPLTEILEGWDSWRGDEKDASERATTYIECAEYFAVRDDALRAHATQVDPNGFFFAVPREVERKVWPTEDYELARSLVESTLPETDLFAGVRENAGTTA
ncbi:MAG: mycothiol conjugate amidase Mca [Corynebacteriales bacterium]|nr:mycothiol conjugate amidase Mca [Mycobacteriales bacterium]